MKNQRDLQSISRRLKAAMPRQETPRHSWQTSMVFDHRGEQNPPLPVSDETEMGNWSILETIFPVDFRHGSWSIGEILRRPTQALDDLALRENPQAFDWRTAAFLDIETTSLRGGAGDVVFLTGIGSFVDHRFVMKQFLVRSPEAEKECIDQIAQELSHYQSVVTYFGKAFDQHRLLGRASIHATEMIFPPNHYDLYWLCKRLLGCKYQSLRLRVVEQEVLGYYRHWDLPGSLAPQVFYDMLRDVECDGLDGVLHHNLIDVVSLIAVAAECSLRMEMPSDWDERRARAQCWWRVGERESACAELDAVVAAERRAGDCLLLADWHRRVRDFSKQRSMLEQALQWDPKSWIAMIGLAKWWEHRGGDWNQAVQYSEWAKKIAPMTMAQELTHRLARLRRKLAGAEGLEPSAP